MAHVCIRSLNLTYNLSLYATREWQPLFMFILPSLVHARSLGSYLSAVLLEIKDKKYIKGQRGT